MSCPEDLADTAVRAVRRVKTEHEPELVAVIPIGGQGGQMMPLTAGMPKTLLPLGDKPLLIHILNSLDPTVFKKALVLCNEWHPMIESYVAAFRSDRDIPVECQSILNAKTAPPAALQQLLKQNQLSDPFLIHYPDVLIEDHVEWDLIYRSYKHHKKTHGPAFAGMLLVSSMFHFNVGVVSLGHDHIIADFKQKPEQLIGGYANCAVALLSANFVQRFVRPNEKDIFDKCLNEALEGEVTFTGYPITAWRHFQQLRDWVGAQEDYYEHIRPQQPRSRRGRKG